MIEDHEPFSIALKLKTLLGQSYGWKEEKKTFHLNKEYTFILSEDDDYDPCGRGGSFYWIECFDGGKLIAEARGSYIQTAYLNIGNKLEKMGLTIEH
jgi:hypothetical protein